MARKQRLRKGRLYAGRAFKGRLLGAEQGATPAVIPTIGGGAAPVHSSSQAVRIPWAWDGRAPGRKKRNRALLLLRP